MAGRKKGGQKGEEFKQEDVLQAVIIADSFNIRFAPITQHKPRALIPLVNAPLLDYTLESLGAAGIEQVIVFCCAHSDQIKQHIRNSQWSNETSSMEVIVLGSTTCRSVGDALRDIDDQSLITSDFVLVNGDMVSNVRLKPIIEQHKARRIKEKTPIMTMLMKKTPPGHTTRCREDEVAMAIKPESERVLSYQKVGTIKKLHMPLELFEEHPSLELRYDLLDCHVSICSPTVPQLFSDNFDYLTREDFIKGILVNEEIFGNTIHVHEIETEYAARVSNLFMYDAISQDVMSRWTYPIVPDLCTATEEKHRHGRHNIYLHKDITLARGCELKQKVVIGKGTSIGSDSVVTKSVIGKNCKIGKNVTIEGAYVWDGVTIEDNCSVRMAVIDNDVKVKTGVHITEGCVLSKGVTVGPDISLEPGLLLMSSPHVDEFEDEQPNQEIDPALVGAEGMGYRYEAPAESDDEMDDLVQEVWGMKIESEEDEELSSEESDLGDDSDVEVMNQPPDDLKQFYDEVIGTLERALTENINIDNLVLEVNGLKSAFGIMIEEVNVHVTKALLDLPAHMNPNLESKQYFPKLKQIFASFLPLLQNYIKNAKSQTEMMRGIEESCVSDPLVLSSATKFLHFFYERDLLTEDILLQWHSNLDTEEDEARAKLHSTVAPLITWLEEAESEEEDDDDDDEE